MRRVRDYLPRSLAWTVLAIFATSALQIAWVATLPGYEAIPFGALEERHHGFSRLGGDGRIPGHVLAACLGAGWAALALGTILVLLLISRRRQLEALNVAENDLLRSIAMNRLLRTVATVAAGLAAIAGNYAARPDPAANVASWTNPAGFAAFLVLLAMWGWAPPKLTRAETPRMGPALGESPAAAHPATRLSVSLGAAMGLAPLAAGVLGFFFPGAGLREQPAILAALMAAAVLLVAAGGELLLQRNYGSPGVPATWPRQAVSPALRTTAIIAVVLFTTVTVMTAAGEMRLSQAGLEASGSWLAAVSATLAVAAIAALPVAAARTRRGIATGVPGLDAALRAITLHRVARTLAASVAAQGGILLITASNTWPPLLGLPLAQSSWQPAVIAGAALTAAGVVIAVIPIRRFARVPATAPSVREGAR